MRLLILVLFLSLSLAACGSSESENSNQKSESEQGQNISSGEDVSQNLNVQEQAGTSASESSVLGTENNKNAKADVAIVNGEPIKRYVYESYLMALLNENPDFLVGDNNKEMADKLKLMALENLISFEVSYQEAVKKGYEPTEEEVNKEFEKLKENFASVGGIEEFLKQNNLTEDQVKNDLKKTLAIQKWVEIEFMKNSIASDAEAKEYYEQNKQQFNHDEQVKVKKIMLLFPVGDQAAAKKAEDKAKQALERLKKGESFDIVQKEMSYSLDDNILDGADEWLTKGQESEEIEKIVFNLKKNQFSEVIKTPFNYQIIKVLDKKPKGMFTFEEVKPQIIEFISSIKQTNAFQKKITDLVDSAKVEILDQTLKAIEEAQKQTQSVDAEPNSEEVPLINNEAPKANE